MVDASPAPAPARSSSGRSPAPRRLGLALAGLLLALGPVGTGAGRSAAAARGAPGPSDAIAEADAAVARLRQQADVLAERYFDTLARFNDLQALADDLEARLPALSTEAQRLRDLMRARAVAASKRAGTGLGTVVSARTLLVAARRVQWLDRLNEREPPSPPACAPAWPGSRPSRPTSGPRGALPPKPSRT